MPSSEILQQISQKKSEKEKIAEQVMENPDLLSEIMDGLNADDANTKFGCDKVLRIVSEKAPQLLYPEFDFFASRIDCENTILKWGALKIIANLTEVDSENKFEKIFDAYFAPIPGPVHTTASNIIKDAAKIARSKPHFTGKITNELLKVENANYKTSECRNIAIGHAILSFDQYFDQIQDRETVIKFVERHCNNGRKATCKKAEKFLRKHSNT